MPKILVVDDEVQICRILKEHLTLRGYAVFTAHNGIDALEVFKEKSPHVVLLDVMMPKMGGIDTLREMKKLDPSVGIIMVTATLDEAVIDEALKLGAHDYITKPFKLNQIETSIMVKISDIIQDSEEKLRESYNVLQSTLGRVIEAMARVVETRDPYTSGHQERVSSLAQVIAEEMGLPRDRIEAIKMSALIHDLGKIYVPAEILSMPRKLTFKEYEIIKDHPAMGHEILKSIEFSYPISEYIFQHHERIDGSGYPKGLSDDNICIEAKILAVADTVEAMASFRPYRPALGLDKALDEILRNRRVLYDPGTVDACIRVFNNNRFSFI